jgi:hypothetical protein
MADGRELSKSKEKKKDQQVISVLNWRYE